MAESVRADQWLWATRFLKTRKLAAEICLTGNVMRNGHPMKPATAVQVGVLIVVPFVEGPGVREISVKALTAKRVGAPEARMCYEDLTDTSVYDALKLWQLAKLEAPKGRPTKRNRREIEKIHGFWD
jgi:ribosome-associated heat shock protein Hsp15